MFCNRMFCNRKFCNRKFCNRKFCNRKFCNRKFCNILKFSIRVIIANLPEISVSFTFIL